MRGGLAGGAEGAKEVIKVRLWIWKRKEVGSGCERWSGVGTGYGNGERKDERQKGCGRENGNGERRDIKQKGWLGGDRPHRQRRGAWVEMKTE